ncbi:MAG: hypothetical protein IJK51_04625 [Bacteroidaceae bacterium]|nr:hypothetical protein [Bacteroidaceae bacterium]
MKKIKLLLAAMAAMVGMSVNAQTWTGNEVGAGTFYLYNVGAQKFLNNGDPLQSWGTNAYLQTGFGLDVVIAEVSTGVYTIETNISNGGNDHFLGNSTWCDKPATNWTFRAVDGETNTYTYQIISDGQYLMANEGLDDVEMVGDPGSRTTSTYWKLVTEDDFKAAMQAKTYSATDPMDVSVFIKGRSFARNDGRNSIWTTSHNGGNWTWIGGSENKYYGNEAWNNTFDVHQEIAGLPDGTYEVKCSGFGTNGTTYIYGNTKMGQLQTDNSTSHGNSKEAKWKAIHEDNAFAGQTTGTFTLSGGNLTVGIKRETNKSQDWAVWDEFRLYYYGLDLSEFAATLAAAVNEAEAVQGTVPAAAYDNLAAVVTEQNKTYTTAAAYTAAANAIVEATNTAKAMQANYSRYQSVREAVLDINNGIDVTAADTAVEAATDNDGIDAAVSTLRNAFSTYLAGAGIADNQIDITAAMIDNAAPFTNADYWTVSQTPSFDATNRVAEFWNISGASIKQTVENLPTGYYRLTAIALGRPNHKGTLSANDFSVNLVGHFDQPSGNTTQGGSWFNDGNGVNELLFNLDNSTDVTIGITADATTGDHWTLWRSFQLEYLGTNPISLMTDRYNEALNAATATRDNADYVNVTGSERTNLQAAIDATPTTVAEYEAAIKSMNDAVAAFTAAKTNYDIYAKERALADAISTDIVVAAPTSAENALTQFRALKVAEYNYVATAYPYSATSKIGEFTSWERTGTLNGNTDVTFEALTSQHWSGEARTYYEQPANGWSTNANTTWTANYQKVTTLPAGSYVIKVAARAASSTSTQAKITCSAATLDGPIFNFGDTGKGITKSGVASFDEGEFCNNGNGRGWVWNYLPFTLTEETTVTMTVVAEAKGAYQWFSVCDGELLSMNDIATAVTYNDASANTIEDVDVANVTMTRNIKADFNTVVLPFDLTANQVQTVFGSGTEVYTFSETSTDPNDVTINFNKVIAGTITANVPVLVKATQASTEQVFKGVQVVAPTAEEVKVEGTNFDFVGTYAPMTVAEGDYFIGNGALYKSAGNTSLKAFRAYIKAKTEASVKMFINGEEFETSISEINGVAENGVIYNLAGQRISKMQKGINIVNGKKVLF